MMHINGCIRFGLFVWALQSLLNWQTSSSAEEEVAEATPTTTSTTASHAWCQSIAYPSTNVDYDLVHLTATHLNRVKLQDFLMQQFCSPKRMSPSKCQLSVDHAHHLLQHQLVEFDVDEMFANVSFDRSLSFKMDVDSFRPKSTSLMASSSRVYADLDILPQTKNETIPVQEFCDEYDISASACDAILARIQEELATQWGCDTYSPIEEEEAERGQVNATETSNATEHQAKRVNPLRLTGEDKLLQARQQAKAQEPIIIPVLMDDPTRRRVMLHLQVHTQSIELQIAEFCWKHTLEVDGCFKLYETAMDALAKRNLTEQNQRVQSIVFQSPIPTRKYPAKEPIHVEFTWQRNPPENQTVCVHLNYEIKPSHCGIIGEKKPLYFNYPPSGVIGVFLVLIRRMRPEELSPAPKLEEVQVQADGQATKHEKVADIERFLAENTLLGASFLRIVDPSIDLLKVTLTSLAEEEAVAEKRGLDRSSSDVMEMFLKVQLQVRSLDVSDPVYRLCVMHDLLLNCWNASELALETSFSVGLEANELVSLIEAPVFNVPTGTHELFFMLMNQFNKVVATTPSHLLNVELAEGSVAMGLISQFVLAPEVPQRPADRHRCQESIRSFVGSTTTSPEDLAWLCDLWQNEFGYFSQNGEDGVLLAIFKRIGSTNAVYVEFGASNGRECNTRFLREVFGWQGLLMDSGHSNDSINLQREFVTPSNVNELFDKYQVPAEFDLLSIDIDFADYHVLNALNTSAFSPRVVVVEYNSHIPFDEPRTVQYGADSFVSWDGSSDYFGASIAAFSKWGQKRGYSLVYCESHGVNCFLIRNDALGITLAPPHQTLLPLEDIFAPPNFFGKGWSYNNVSQGDKPWIWV